MYIFLEARNYFRGYIFLNDLLKIHEDLYLIVNSDMLCIEILYAVLWTDWKRSTGGSIRRFHKKKTIQMLPNVNRIN